MRCREGFFSKLESSASNSANNAEPDMSFGDQNNGESAYTCRESHMSGISTSSELEIAVDGNMSQQEFGDVTEVVDRASTIVGNEHEISMEYEGHEQEVSLCSEGNHQEVSLGVRSANSTEEQDLDGEATQQQISAANEVTEREVSAVLGAGNRHGEEINNEFLLEIEDINQRGANDIFLERYVSRSGLSSIHEATAPSLDLETNTDEPGEFHESITNQLFQETSDNDALEQEQMQGSHNDWPSHDLQEAINSWLDMPSGEVGASVERTDTYYFSDDDNVHSIELRELFSRYMFHCINLNEIYGFKLIFM